MLTLKKYVFFLVLTSDSAKGITNKCLQGGEGGGWQTKDIIAIYTVNVRYGLIYQLSTI